MESLDSIRDGTAGRTRDRRMERTKRSGKERSVNLAVRKYSDVCTIGNHQSGYELISWDGSHCAAVRQLLPIVIEDKVVAGRNNVLYSVFQFAKIGYLVISA